MVVTLSLNDSKKLSRSDILTYIAIIILYIKFSYTSVAY